MGGGAGKTEMGGMEQGAYGAYEERGNRDEMFRRG